MTTTKQPRGFIVFRSPDDLERYGTSNAEDDRRAVRTLFEAGHAAYVTEIAEFDMETFDGKPYVKIENDDLWPNPWYMAAGIAERMRWRYIPEDEYAARDWKDAAFTAWAKDDLPEVERLFGRAAAAHDASTALVSESLLLRACILRALDREMEAESLLNEVEERFAQSEDGQTRAYAAEALFDKGVMIADQGEHERAITVFDVVIGRYGADPEPVVLAEVAPAMMQKGVQLCETGRFDEAVAVNDDLIDAYRDSTVPRVRQQVAIGTRNKAGALQRLNRLQDALEECDELIRYGEAAGPRVTPEFAWGFYSKAGNLRRLGQPEQARTVLSEVVSRFDGYKDKRVQAMVEDARKRLSDAP
jgi:tetratricopeptide (TPR) repeat protein